MIEQITIKNFKSFKDVTVKLGPLNIFIGSNASGKSNFFDALRVLQGIGYGFTLSEILNGKPKSATSEVWEGIRGGSSGIPFGLEKGDLPTSFEVDGSVAGENHETFTFNIEFSALYAWLREENLSLEQFVYGSYPKDEGARRPSFEISWSLYPTSMANPNGRFPIEGDQPALVQVTQRGDKTYGQIYSEMADQVAHVLADMQRIDPSPALLREYSKAYEIKRMGEQGENFAALIRTVCDDPGTKEAYVDWLRELRPREVDDVGVLKGALGEPMLMMKEGEREWLAPVLSDGTLRFAALAAAFFQPDMPGILTIEEIENGIHASRLRLLVELMRSQAAARKTQVMVTTHSPLVLAWLKPEEYATTFYCKRDEETGESHIYPLSEIPRFQEIVSKQPISDLFAEGWMETAL